MWLLERKRMHNHDLHTIFVGQEKAFDRAHKEKLWKILGQHYIKGQLFDNVRAICFKSTVRKTSGLSNWFTVTSGLTQGYDFLYVIYMYQITKEATRT